MATINRMATPTLVVNSLVKSDTHRLLLVGILFVFAVTWFAMLGSYQLLDPDEGRYAEIPREMAVSGDWITPRLNGIKYFEKPPLQYWATAAAYSVFGIEVWSSRLWVALTGFLGILLTWWLGRRLYGRQVGLLAAAIQAGTMLYAALGHMNTLDMGLSFSLQVALTGLVLLIHPQEEQRRLQAALLLAVGVTLAFLSKGLVGILIPSAVAALYVLFSGDWKLILRARPWWTLLVLIAVVSPWLVSVSQHNPEFLRFFFIHEHFERFLSRVHARYQPAWFFVPVLLIGFMPWTPLLPRVVMESWRAVRSGDRVTLLLSLWTIFILLFFSISQSKLIPYILPIFSALALLTARTVNNLDVRRMSRYLWIASAVWLAIGGIGAVLHMSTDLLEVKAGAAATGAILAFVLAGASVAIAASIATNRSIALAVCAASLSSLLFTSIALVSAQHMPKLWEARAVANQLSERLTPNTSLYCVDDYLQSIPFYLQRTCKLVGYRGELDFGLQQEPKHWLPDLGQFAEQWHQSSDAVAIMRHQSYDTLLKQGTSMQVIFKGETVVAVAR
jgi:4-amino-4-deoxy-L-arabinose transferase-like glycosyltransferase